MKPEKKITKIIYRVINRETGAAMVVSAGGLAGIDHDSLSGLPTRDGEYRIAKYRTTYKLLDGDCKEETGN